MTTKLIFKRVAILLTLPVLTAMFSGCATITQGSSQTITVDTSPPGAICTLKREGQTLAIVNPTPGSITIDKDKDPINVACEKKGYKTNIGDVGSEFQGMTFGNVIFGGLVGVAIDAGSGAMNQYPPTITLTLIPESFETEKEKNLFFDNMRDQFMRESEASMKQILQYCDADDCDHQVQLAKDAQELKFAEIERERARAEVR